VLDALLDCGVLVFIHNTLQPPERVRRFARQPRKGRAIVLLRPRLFENVGFLRREFPSRRLLYTKKEIEIVHRVVLAVDVAIKSNSTVVQLRAV